MKKPVSVIIIVFLCTLNVYPASINLGKLEQNANKGSVKAQMQLAELYENGDASLPIPINLDSALVWYKMASEKNKEAAVKAGSIERQLAKSTKLDGAIITWNKDRLQESAKYFEVYLVDNKKASQLYKLLLAEDYIELKSYKKAWDIYVSNYSDGLSKLRMAQLLYDNKVQSEVYGVKDQIRLIESGLQTTSITVDEFVYASKIGRYLLPFCYLNIGEDETAKIKFMEANFSEGEAEWQIYKEGNANIYTPERLFRHLKNSADLGHPEALNKIADILYKEKKYLEAEPYAIKCTENDSTNVFYFERVGNIYFNTSNNAKAFPFWLKAAQLGSGSGNIRVGQAYSNGFGCDKNDSLAIVYFEEGLKTKTWPWAQNMLACIYTAGTFLDNPNYNLQRGQYWWDQASQQGDMEAKSHLALSLYTWYKLKNDSVLQKIDLSKALILANEVLSNNPKNLDAWKVKSNILWDSIMSDTSKIDFENLKQQRKILALFPQRDSILCTILANNGYIDECVELAQAFTEGRYFYTDYFGNSRQVYIDTCGKKSFEYWSKAYKIDNKNSKCVEGLVKAYTYGIGVQKNVAKAKELFESIWRDYSGHFYYEWLTWQIQQGDMDKIIAQAGINEWGKLYMPYTESMKWLLNAASKGNNKQKQDALYELGSIYESGKFNFPKDCKKAINYYKQSAALGSSAACYHLGWIYRTGSAGVQMNCETAAEYYHKCYNLSGDNDAYYYYIHCLNRTY